MLKVASNNHRTEMTEQRRHAIQTQLAIHERAFGEVSPRKDPAPDTQPENSPAMGLGNTQPQHPLLKDSQQFSGMEPSQVSSVADNLDAAEALIENAQQLAEKYPELQNHPALTPAMRMEIQNRLRHEYQPKIAQTPKLNPYQ